MFSCEHCKIFENDYFKEHMQTTSAVSIALIQEKNLDEVTKSENVCKNYILKSQDTQYAHSNIVFRLSPLSTSLFWWQFGIQYPASSFLVLVESPAPALLFSSFLIKSDFNFLNHLKHEN